jgi:hypothetical protein
VFSAQERPASRGAEKNGFSGSRIDGVFGTTFLNETGRQSDNERFII